MEKKVITMLLLLSVSFFSKAQVLATSANNFSIVHLPKFYKEKGVVFNKDYNVGIDIKNVKNRYTPTISDIERVEEIFISQYNKVFGTAINAKKEYCRYVRQYFGVIDSSGKRNIIVQLINNNRPGKINRLLGKRWEDDFVIMLSDSFYEVSTIFAVNIDKEEMSIKF